MKLFCSFLIAAFFMPTCLPAQSGTIKQVILSNFYLQSSEVIPASGKDLSNTSYVSKNYWFPVKVPCTVLTGLVQNKLYPDPYIGINNMFIPDASDSFNNEYHLGKFSHIPNEPNPWKRPYWYRTTFTVPASDKGKHFQLIFKGINYRAAVWLNGKMIADSSQMAGMFSQYFLDVTDAIDPGKENGLAVEIYPLDYPGLPSHPQLDALGDFYANGGPTGDIGKNVTMLSSVGWDWIPEVRDRNMGIWLPVYLRTTGSVIITRPQVITELPNLPDTSIANISLSFTLNNDAGRDQAGILKIFIKPDNFKGNPIQIIKSISSAGTGDHFIKLDAKEFPLLTIHRPT